MAQPVEPTAEKAPRRGRGCLLVGCILVALLVAVPLAAVWALYEAVEHAGPPDPRHVELTHPLPAGTGRVRLHLGMADVDVTAAPAGSPLRVVAEWDANSCRLTESFRPTGDGWSYDLTLGARGMRIPALHNGSTFSNHVRVFLPAGVPLELGGKLAMGQSDLALGGLALRSVDLELAMGEHRLSFAEPTSAPLDLLRLRGGMGELTVLRTGNASPRRVEVQHRMGDLTLDLAGGWRNDSDVEIRVGMGDGQVQLPGPQEAHAVVEEAHMALGDGQVHPRSEAGSPVPPGLPTLRLRARGGMGDLEIR